MQTQSQNIRSQTFRGPVSSSSTTVHSRLAGIGWYYWRRSMWPSLFPTTSALLPLRSERTEPLQHETLPVSATSWWRYCLLLVKLATAHLMHLFSWPLAKKDFIFYRNQGFYIGLACLCSCRYSSELPHHLCEYVWSGGLWRPLHLHPLRHFMAVRRPDRCSTIWPALRLQHQCGQWLMHNNFSPLLSTRFIMYTLRCLEGALKCGKTLKNLTFVCSCLIRHHFSHLVIC